MEKIDLKNKCILVTGAIGFIGYYICKRLLDEYPKSTIIGIDNINDYYDVDLKKYRLSLLEKYNNFNFIMGDISNKRFVFKIFKNNKIDVVINLAAQAGVRYSIDNPDTYIKSNIIGFYNMLEVCRKYPVLNFIFASSSSVYGNSNKYPSCVEDRCDKQESLYAATKKCDEVLAYTYSSLYDINCTGLRFFTVYGPLGRPDMAYFSFIDKWINREKVKIFNYGKCQRDFTYIDDIVEGLFRVIHCPNRYKIYNIGNGKPVNLLDFVEILEKELVNNKLVPKDFNFDDYKELVDSQDGDVDITYCDTSLLEKDFNYSPKVDINEGIKEFIKWYKEYYKK